MTRFTLCANCSGGNHGDCLVSFCTCPLEQCSASRNRGDWKEHVMIMGIEIPDLNLPDLIGSTKSKRRN